MNTRIISRYLQLLRKSHNYTQEELAKKLDISRQAVSKWETGVTLPDVIASMGASPEINKLLERLFQNIDYKLLREQIGVVRITEVEAIQKEIVSMINL